MNYIKTVSTIDILSIAIALIACNEQSKDQGQSKPVDEQSNAIYTYKESELPYLTQFDCSDIDGLSMFEEVPDDYEGFTLGECYDRDSTGDKLWRLAYISNSNGQKHVVYHGWRNENQLYEERILVDDTIRSFRIWHENGKLQYYQKLEEGGQLIKKVYDEEGTELEIDENRNSN